MARPILSRHVYHLKLSNLFRLCSIVAIHSIIRRRRRRCCYCSRLDNDKFTFICVIHTFVLVLNIIPLIGAGKIDLRSALDNSMFEHI
jgi:hypothetical protein